jgi:hypothetical protein
MIIIMNLPVVGAWLRRTTTSAASICAPYLQATPATNKNKNKYEVYAFTRSFLLKDLHGVLWLVLVKIILLE